MYHYIGNLYRPTVITNAITANFLNSQSQINLIVSKSNILEIFNVVKEGLESVPYLSFFGNINVLDKITINPMDTNSKDNLFIITDDLDYCILNYVESKKEVRTIEKGTVKEDIGKKLDKILYAIDKIKYQYIVCMAFKNLVKVISLQKSTVSFTVRVDYDDILLFQPIFSNFNGNNQVFGMVSTIIDSNGQQQSSVLNSYMTFRTFNVDFSSQKIDFTSNMQIPNWTIDLTKTPDVTFMFSPRFGGLVLFFSNSVKYFPYNSNNFTKIVNFKERKVICYCPVDDNRYIVGDDKGDLFLLGFSKNNEMIFHFMGEINYFSCIVYLDNYFVFAGSSKANSQLVKFLNKINTLTPNRPLLEVVEEYDNLGPIVDFTLVNSSNKVNNEILCVSGSGKNCGLKLLRKGISLSMINEFVFSYLKDVFVVNATINNASYSVVFLSRINSTDELYFNQYNDNVEFNLVQDIERSISTLIALNYNDLIIQVTKNQLIVYKEVNLKYIYSCKFKNDVVSVKYQKSTGNLFMMNSINELIKINLASLSHEYLPELILSDLEISCLEVKENVVYFGTWNSQFIQRYDFTTGIKNNLIEIDQNTFANSIKFLKSDTTKYMFVSLTNGILLYLKKLIRASTIEDSDYRVIRRYSISNSIFDLSKIKINMKSSLFINTEIPSFLQIIKENPVVSTFNTKNCSKAINLDINANQKDLYAFVFDSSLVLGKLSNDQSHSISTKFYDGQIYKIHSINERNVFVMIKEAVSDDSFPISSLLVIDKNLEILDKFDLDQTETSFSFKELRLMQDFNEKIYIAIGTGYIENECEEPTTGRIILFELTENNRLLKVSELEVQGGVYTINANKNNLYVSSGSVLQIFTIKRSSLNKNGFEFEIKLLAKNNDFNAINDFIIHDEFIVVSDLYKSVTVLKYDENKERIVEVCRDFLPTLVQSLSLVDNNYYLAADIECNLRILKKSLSSKNDEDRFKLDRISQINLGERINKFVSVPKNIESKEFAMLCNEGSSNINVSYFCTMEGSIGILIPIDQKIFDVLFELQNEILRRTVNTGNLNYEKWRSYKDGYINEPQKKFVEGFILDEFLEYEMKQRNEIFQSVIRTFPSKYNCHEVFQLIETLKKLI